MQEQRSILLTDDKPRRTHLSGVHLKGTGEKQSPKIAAMAQLDSRQRYRDESAQSPNSPTIEQLLFQGDSPSWAPTASSPTYGKDHFGDHPPHNKKSVLAKVREKAKKWRQTLSKKKQNHDGENTTPSWGVSLEDDDEDTDEDPEYLGAPMYESELAPEDCKEAARQHPREVTAKPKDNVVASRTVHSRQDKEKPHSPTKTVTETVTEKLTPAYETVAGATHTITSKLQSLTVGHPASIRSEMEQQASGNNHTWDKGVSVKEFLIQKLEPGEDEKALSQVISEAISPRKAPGESGVVQKVREAVSSLIRAEEPSPLRVTTSSYASHIPISTNAHEVHNEETQGRILQAN